jgi:TatD DNase family protein
MSLPTAPSAPEVPLVYPLGRNLYVNVTSQCNNRCVMCWKFSPDQFHGLHLLYREPACEPSPDAVVAAIESWPKPYQELVFCGLGEPLRRADAVLEIAARVRPAGHSIRVNTDGLACLREGPGLLPRMEGLLDALSVSLNAQDRETYNRLCQPTEPERAFDAVLAFLRDAPRYVPSVTATVVANRWVDVEACRRLAASLGVEFRSRSFDPPPAAVRLGL